MALLLLDDYDEDYDEHGPRAVRMHGSGEKLLRGKRRLGDFKSIGSASATHEGGETAANR